MSPVITILTLLFGDKMSNEEHIMIQNETGRFRLITQNNREMSLYMVSNEVNLVEYRNTELIFNGVRCLRYTDTLNEKGLC